MFYPILQECVQFQQEYFPAQFFLMICRTIFKQVFRWFYILRLKFSDCITQTSSNCKGVDISSLERHIQFILGPSSSIFEF